MGAEYRELSIKGRDFRTAWKNAVEEDEYERGHDYYAGLIGTVHDIRKVSYDTFEKYLEGELDLSKCEAVYRETCSPKGNTNKIKTQVERHPVKGTRKWETVYEVIKKGYLKESLSFHKMQADAIKDARNRCEKDQCNYEVRIAKRLIGGQDVTLCANISYKSSKTESDGRWDIYACVPC